jgi:hypothetical protein
MGSLLLVLLGLIGVFLISRINGSTKLFWILLIAFIGGMAGGALVSNYMSNKHKDTTCIINPYTQMSNSNQVAELSSTIEISTSQSGSVINKINNSVMLMHSPSRIIFPQGKSPPYLSYDTS